MKTYGYDFAFALSIDTVNTIMAKNLANVDMTIAYSTVDPESGSKLTLNAKLAPWQIVPGGQNALLNLNVPIASGSLKLEGGVLSGTYDLGGVTPEMQITLGWIGTGDTQDATGSGDTTHLTFNPSGTTNKDAPGYVATLQIHDPQKKLDDIATGILSTVMVGALYSNKEKIKYIFANVNPAPSAVGSWLKPAKWQYYFAGTSSVNALCFLSVLSVNSKLPSVPAFDSSAFEAGSNSTLLVSQPEFFQNVVLPGVQAAFPGGRFTLSTTSEEVSTVRNVGNFDVDRVTATSFALSPSNSGDGLAMSSSGGGPLKFFFGLADLPGASYSWSLSTLNPLRFNGQQITFANDPHPVESQDHTIKWYDWVLLVVVGITTIAGIVSAIYDGVNKFYDKAEQMGMGSINQNLQNTSGGTVANLATLIDWSIDGQKLAPKDAGLNGALYVRGNLA